MTDILSNIKTFVEYACTLKGDEKGESQVFNQLVKLGEKSRDRVNFT
jgi:hypothetical protein